MKFTMTGKKLFFLLCVVVFLSIFLQSHSPINDTSEIITLGWRMYFRDWVSPPQRSEDIVLLPIDEHSRNEYGRFPWGRDTYAKLIEILTSPDPTEGPRVIAFDFLFSQPDEAHDELFAQAIKKAQNVVLAIGYSLGESTSGEIVFRPLAEKLRELDSLAGAVIVYASPDDRVIALPLAVEGFCPVKKGNIYYKAFEYLILEKSRGDSAGPRIDFLHSPPYLISYRGEPDTIFPSYSFSDVTEGRVPRENFRDKIVMVVNRIDVNDRFKTTRGDRIFGGEIHAYALRTLLKSDFIATNRIINIFIYVFMCLCSILIIARLRSRVRAFVQIFLIIGFYSLMSFLLFAFFSLWLPLVLPALGALLFSAGYVFLEHYTMKKTIGSFLPDSFVEKLDTVCAQPEAGGKLCFATVLFADIRGYTDLSETLSPVEVMNMLNEYHGLVKDAIYDNGGEIFDFQGDAYMVVYGADGCDEEHARKAVLTAIRICKVLEEQGERWKKEGKQTLEVGIGICSGEIALGYVGHEKKLQPAAIGDTTNVAARLQGKSSQFKTPILMTETTMCQLKGAIPTVALSPVELKGKREKLVIYTVDWEKIQELLSLFCL